MGDMRIGELFAGYGGLGLGVKDAIGGELAWVSEIEDAPSRILKHHWPDVPNLGDITKINWEDVPPVDILTGGFPCQDLSLAGRRKGMRPGTRSGLWADFAKAIDVLRPSLVVIENVGGLLSGCAESESDSELGSCARCADPDSRAKHAPNVRALGRVLIDLARIGYDARWDGLGAYAAGAPHGRFRVFVVAYPQHDGDASGAGGRGAGAGFAPRRHEGLEAGAGGEPSRASGGGVGSWKQYELAIRRWEAVTGHVAPAPTNPDGKGNTHRLSARFVEWMMGLPDGHVTSVGLTRNEQLKALGNGVVPQQAELAVRTLLGVS